MPDTAVHSQPVSQSAAKADHAGHADDFGVRRIGAVNWGGLQTLAEREIRRFMKVWMQTVLAPSVQAVLFFLIFAVVIGGSDRVTTAVPYEQFLAPGLAIMALTQNAFQNTASSLIIGKVQGTVIDVLMPPLSAGELVMGYVLGGVARALVVCGVLLLVFWVLPLDAITVTHPWAILYFGLMAAIFMSLIGLLTGVWAEKFDHVATITNFIVAPLTLLSGTFYSVGILKERMADGGWGADQLAVLDAVLAVNPFFYVIDGFRYGFIGTADASLPVGVAFIGVANAALALIAWRVFRSGWKLKA
ncbi:ABC-2 type transport system permease protein [Rhodothalassium salexigens DSM 2132]|uniref:Transport permease protein n=1 Tax=Rhodothalassium salexigens DSM 2132 TaxID=1188247 RepID=A0A4R2PKU8_RHOSA|nr:ABC transporter permease [Rhodothalassium salexigens]MBB4211141.1 ABC-2 type transport system permease protein [Rhodothalassium salexigens DSM 2132]MBK1637482.1 hypothetical protein [Rhodothalassium salexigens DSM 2132]TCP36203.1 ABC-2 type transport system permease protein [Rhodothalassium salexigens DSM 2132]